MAPETDTSHTAELDPSDVGKYALNVWQYKQGEVVSLLIHLGDRLGLYRRLEGRGPTSAAELAEETGLHERWLLEWLKNQGAARILDYHEGDRFSLSPVGAAVMADEQGSLAFACGAFSPPWGEEFVDRLCDAFQTGRGLSYDELGPIAAHRTERMLGPWTRLALVPQIIPALDGVQAKLEAGADVVDVGCGAGVALIALATAYPKSQFHGFDPSHHAIERARAGVAAAGLQNITLHEKGGEGLPGEPTFDLVITLDCIHDMPHPATVIEAIRRAIRPDGTWLIKDIRSQPSFEANLANPLLAMMYGFSITACMSSALSEPGGAGLGTLGFNPEVAEQMTSAAGFTRFRPHDFQDPANLYYEVRP
jgi:2-polyprenyl-3-methyl-5-hydroxy-6-metoxy-1,4-benzoquinol methylase